MSFPIELIKRLFTILVLFLFLTQASIGQDFITQWIFSESATDIRFSASTTDSVDYTWTASPSGNSGSGRFLVAIPGRVFLGEMEIEAGDTVVLRMAPQHLKRFYFDNWQNNRLNLRDVLQWGSASWTSMFATFFKCKHLNISANDNPKLSNVKDMGAMFFEAESFDQDINDWDVSNVTDMSNMFSRAKSFNGNISDWDVSNVTNMSAMFANAYLFNQDIGDWDVANVENMQSMFAEASTFNQDINDWNVSNVEDMWAMFINAESFNQDIGNWDVSSVSRMRRMFKDAILFNKNIGNWDVSNVTDMKGMFENATSFDQNLNDWDVSNVVYMSNMFKGANSFDHLLNKWNVSKVTEMDEMFNGASSFNQDIGDWNVANVTTMRSMFYDASSFNQDIGDWNVYKVFDMSYMFEGSNFNQPIHNWDVSNVEDMRGMFLYTNFNQNLGDWKLNSNVRMDKMLAASGMDCDHYSASLVGWNENNPNVTHVILGANELRYGTSAKKARDSLVFYKEWNINGDKAVNSSCDALVSSEFIPFHNQDYHFIYPNPTSGLINVEGHPFEFNEVRLVNSVGMDVTAQIGITKRNSTSTTLDLRNLETGIYYLQTKSSSGIVLKK